MWDLITHYQDRSAHQVLGADHPLLIKVIRSDQHTTTSCNGSAARLCLLIHYRVPVIPTLGLGVQTHNCDIHRRELVVEVHRLTTQRKNHVGDRKTQMGGKTRTTVVEMCELSVN